MRIGALWFGLWLLVAGTCAVAAQDQPAMAAADVATTASLTRVVEASEALRWRLGAMIAALPDLPFALLFLVDRLTGDGDPRRIMLLLAGCAAVLGIATAAEAAFRRLFAPIGRRPEDDRSPPPGDFGKLALLAMAALIDALALGVFALAGGLAFLALQPGDEFLRTAFWAGFLALLGTRIVVILARMALAPRRPMLRLPPLDDASARHLFQWMVMVAALICGCAVFVALSRAAGLPEALEAALGLIVHWCLTIVLVLLVWRQRRTIGRLLTVSPAARSRSRATDYQNRNAHVLLACLIIGLTLLSTVSRLLTGQSHVLENLATLVLLAVLPAVDGLLRMLVRWIVPPSERAMGTTNASPAEAAVVSQQGGPPPTMPTPTVPPPPVGAAGSRAVAGDFAPVIVRNLRIGLAVLSLLLLDWIWGIDLHAIAAGSLGVRIAGSLFDIIVTLIIASAVWGVVSTAVMRHAPQDGLDALAELEGEGGGTGLTRLQTLLPLLRKFLLVVMVVIVGMIIISSLGIDIGPLLAGAGVVGIAVGFGAQTLVRDIFSGIFFLIDDAFRVGEYIDVGQAKGTVERISIRSLRLRHHLGPIHTIPFGAIDNVTNFSRDWVIMKLELRLPADTDLEKVRKLVKRLGEELLTHPEYGPQFLQPLKSQGVHRMDDDAFIVRVKFMARPGEQFVLRREVYRRIQELFGRNGIHFAPRRVIVDAAAHPETAAVAAAAAAAAGSSPRASSGAGTS